DTSKTTDSPSSSPVAILMNGEIVGNALFDLQPNHITGSAGLSGLFALNLPTSLHGTLKVQALDVNTGTLSPPELLFVTAASFWGRVRIWIDTYSIWIAIITPIVAITAIARAFMRRRIKTLRTYLAEERAKLSLVTR